MKKKVDPATASPDQIDEARKNARRWKPRVAVPPEEGNQPEALGLLSELWPAFAEELERRADGSFDPISTGLPDLDKALGGGFPRGGITMLPAAPGTGKTTFMLWIGLDRAKEGTPVIFWSLELTRTDALARVVSILQGQPWGEVRRGLHSGPVKLAGEQVQPFPFAVHGADSCPDVASMERLAETMKARYGKAPLLVIDYAQLLVDELTGEVRASASALSKSVAGLAGRTGAAVVGISSVGRTAYNVLDKKGRPDLDRVLGMCKESGQFEYDSAAVLALIQVRDPEDEEGRFKKLWAVIAKDRYGCPGRMAPLQYDGMTGRWQEITVEDMPAVGTPKATPEALRDQILDLVDRQGPELTSMAKVREKITGRRERTIAMVKAMMHKGELAGGTTKEPFHTTGQLAKNAVLALFRESFPDG